MKGQRAAWLAFSLWLLAPVAVAASPHVPPPPSMAAPIHRVPARGLAASIADSAARVLVKLAPGERMAALDRAQLARQHELVHVLADTLDDDLLLAVQEFGTQELALRLIGRGEWRAVLDRAVPPGGDGREHLLEQVVLGRAREGLDRHPRRLALLWFEEAGSAAPHTLWLAPVDSLPYHNPDVIELPARQAGWDEGGGLVVLRKRDEVLVRTLSNWGGTSSFNAYFCGACTHLVLETDWLVDCQIATALRVQPRDDAAFAVARAFDARHGHGKWAAADLDVAPAVAAWLSDRDGVELESAFPLGDGDARVRLWGMGPEPPGSAVARGSADTLGIVVRHIGKGAAARWSLR